MNELGSSVFLTLVRVLKKTYLVLSLENDTIVPELPVSCRNFAANVKSFVFLSCSAARWYTVVGKTRFRSPPIIINKKKTNINLCINQLSNKYGKTMNNKIHSCIHEVHW